ncbi:MAG: ribosome silencing factor [Polyangiales bacterium]
MATKKDGGKGATKKRKRAATSKTEDGAVRAGKAEAEARALALAIAAVALEHKALNVEIIDVRGKVDYSDYVVVMSGRSDRQVAALARNLQQALEQRGQRCIGVEGLPHASWLLMDFGDVIVHIFHEDTRGYYDLETLWIDAARLSVE